MKDHLMPRTPQEEAELKPLWDKLEKLKAEKRKHPAGSPKRLRLLHQERAVRDECYRVAGRYNPKEPPAGFGAPEND
jgi:hypothetical protein